MRTVYVQVERSLQFSGDVTSYAAIDGSVFYISSSHPQLCPVFRYTAQIYTG